MLRCGAALVALTLAASPLFADEAEDFLKRAYAARYSPADHGLKDLRVEFKNNMFAMNPAMAGVHFIFYWKAPDKKACKVDGAQGPAAAQMAMMAQGMAKGLAPMIVPGTYESQAKKFDFAVSADGDLTKVAMTPKPGTEEASMITSTTLWFDKRNLPVRQETQSIQGGPMTVELTYVEKDGKLLVETVKGEQAGQPVGATITYTQVEGMWFPETITQEQMGMKVVISLEGYEVNKGVDDSLFGEGGGEK